jgi:hypothetical protein
MAKSGREKYKDKTTAEERSTKLESGGRTDSTAIYLRAADSWISMSLRSGLVRLAVGCRKLQASRGSTSTFHFEEG